MLDFIKNPTPKSNPIAPLTPVTNPVPQYVVPVNAQNKPEDDAKNKVDTADVARQAYVASLLKSNQPSVATTSIADKPPVNSSANATSSASPQASVPPEAPKKHDAPSSEKNQATSETNPMSGAPVEVSKQELLDLMTHLTARSNKCIALAQAKAKELQCNEVDGEHMLIGLMSDSTVYKILTDLHVQMPQIETELDPIYKRTDKPTIPQLSGRLKHILNAAHADVRKVGLEFVAPEHILLALLQDGEGPAARVLTKLGLNAGDLTELVYPDAPAGGAGNPLSKFGLGTGSTDAQGATAKSALAEYTIDLTAKAQRGEFDPVVERSSEIERVVHVLSRRTKNNPALIGEPGVGKTAVVEGLAQQIVSGLVPSVLIGKKLLQLDLMAVLAGASHRGEFEQRMKDIIDEVIASNNQIIMFIDEMHTIVGAGAGEGSGDAANFLKPALARGDMQLIGATTITEYRKYIEKDPALERRFQTVQVDEPNEEAAIKMIMATKSKYEKFHKVLIPDDAIEAAVKLSKRYVGDRFLPDKAIDLIDEAASAVRLPLMSLPEEIKSLQTRLAQWEGEKNTATAKGDSVRVKVLTNKMTTVTAELNEKQSEYDRKKMQSVSEVTEDIVKDIVSRWTGVPVSKMSSGESTKLTQLEVTMHKRMIGQERAVKAVAAAVRRGRAGLKSNARPIGSFIFLGPSGTGKTELAKTLAEVLFGLDDAMIRFDMTEFMEKHEVAKLLGPPPGYVGYEEGGKLTEAVRRKPYSVVLFDEIEKAHPDIFNILLQVLDDGRLTDNKGRTISFKNTVVICTSNIGSVLIQDQLLKKANTPDGSQPQPSVQDELEVKAGSQNTKRAAEVDHLNTEYTDMKSENIDVAMRGQKANLDEVELPTGHQFVDEQDGDVSSKDYTALKEMVMGELRKFFRPELINRFDEVVVFEPLQFKHMKKIVELQLKTLSKLLEEQNLGLSVTEKATEQIVIAGFDPVYGARPLRRAVQRLLENPISEMIITRGLTEGDIVVIDYVNDDFVFTAEKPKQIMRDSDSGVGSEKRMMAYRCTTTGYEFTTEVKEHATVICPVNVKEKVEKKAEASQQPIEAKAASVGAVDVVRMAQVPPVASVAPAQYNQNYQTA
ncbi:MAG: ATP-dependent Clp protease ATP-binding subunit [Candidatus Roizmanbacteria bacterium]